MMRFFGLLTIICVAVAATVPARSDAPVTIFAAASLRGALEAALEGSDTDARISYGGSGTMARQVAQGAPADIVILANVAWMDWLQEQGHLAPSTRADLLGNRLVLVGPQDAPALAEVTVDGLLARLAGGRLAVGHTQAVPAGIYAKQWMQAAGLWDALRPQLAETENVRAALALVSRGETPLGVVYASDAEADRGVQVLSRIDPALHDPIVYPAALVAGRETEAAKAVLAQLRSEAAGQAFVAHGFSLAGRAP